MKSKMLVSVLLILLVSSCRERGAGPEDVPTTDPSAVSTAAGPPPTLTTTGSPPPAQAVGGNVVNVRMVDYRFEMPNQLPAGRTTFQIRNEGEQKHNFEIEGQGIEEELPSDLEPKSSGELTVELKPGRYRVYCPVGDHAEKRGMETWVTVI